MFRHTLSAFIPAVFMAAILSTPNPAKAEEPPAGCIHAHHPMQGASYCEPGQGELIGEFCCPATTPPEANVPAPAIDEWSLATKSAMAAMAMLLSIIGLVLLAWLSRKVWMDLPSWQAQRQEERKDWEEDVMTQALLAIKKIVDESDEALRQDIQPSRKVGLEDLKWKGNQTLEAMGRLLTNGQRNFVAAMKVANGFLKEHGEPVSTRQYWWSFPAA